MGRDFRNVAVVKGYLADGCFVTEDVLPLASFHSNDSRLLSSAQVRQQNVERTAQLNTAMDQKMQAPH